MRKATDQRDAQTISLLWTSLLLFHGGDVTCFDACHVIWCGGHVIWCDVIACVCRVTWCNAMSCDVRSCDVPCNGHVVCSKRFCDNVVIQSTMLYYKVLLCTTKYYSSTTLYYKVLLQYYSVLQKLLQYFCTTKYYSSTTLYYKVLLQYYSVLHSTTTYYSVLQRTTPVLLCTTKYYSSTTLYCTVLPQYYSVLQGTTPVLLCATKYHSSTTLYYKVLLQYYSVLQSTTPVLLCTTQYYNVLLQYYSVLKYYSSTTLYYKAAFVIDPWHIWTAIYMIDVRRIWNVIYNARSNRSHPATSPNTAPATQNDCDDWSASHMKRHLQCAEQAQSASNLTKHCACHEICKFKISAETPWIASANRKTIRRHSEHNPTIKSSSRTRRFGDLTRPILETHFVWKNTTFRAPPIYQNFTRCCACHEEFTKYCACQAKWISWLMRVSYMKRHFQLAEQAKSTSNLSKYCACHKIFKFKIALETLWIASANRKTTRRHSEHNPTMKWSSRTHRFGDLTRPILETTSRAPAISQNCTKCCAWHEKSHSNFTKYRAWHEKSTLLFSTLFFFLAFILFWHLFPLGIYSLLAPIPSWHLLSLGIYSLLASILSRHLFSLGIYSLLASILSWHLFSPGTYSLYSLGIYSRLGASPLGIFFLLASTP